MNKPTSEWLHRPFLLNEEELADPSITISNFLHNRDLPAHRDILWDIMQAALTSTKHDYTSAEEVAEWVLYYRKLNAFIEASYELNTQNQRMSGS